MNKYKQVVKSKNTIAIFLSLLIFSIVYSFSGYFDLLNKDFQNSTYIYKGTFNDWKANKNIIVVEIDENTLNRMGRFPFNREVYPKVIKKLNDEGVAIIGLDIIFSDTTDNIQDDKFAQSIKDAGNIILGTVKSSNNIIEMPLKKFTSGAKGIGYFPPNIYNKNKVTYGVDPYIEAKRYGYMDHFAIKIFKAYYSYIYNKNYIDYVSSIEDGFLNLIPGKKVILSGEKRKDEVTGEIIDDMLISYINSREFTKISFIDIYDDNQFEILKQNINLKDKIIIIGAAADGLQDNFFTPNEGEVYGVYIHANIINTILRNQYIRYFDKNIEWVLIFLLIVLSVYFNLSRSGYILIASNIAIVSLFLVIFQLFITYFTPLILNYTVELLLALIISLTLSNTVKYLFENKQKAKLNKALSEYVSEDIASEILSGTGKVNLDGENKKVAIFFSDLEGFTSISEKLSPEELVFFLREYLGEMSTIIMDNKGFINKFEGDAIMALWGVFGEKSEENSFFACLSAIQQQKRLQKLNQIWKEKGYGKIHCRIGIHNGNAIIGNIGAKGRKMEFTALGDSVNIASRLEGVNKYYNTYICTSEEIYKETKKSFEFRYLDKIRVKGKEKPVKIYELICLSDEITDEILDKVQKFGFAINLYQERDFQTAKNRFRVLADAGDKPSLAYIERCEEYIKNPPPANWDGVWEMKEK